MKSKIYLQIDFWHKLESDTTTDGIRTLFDVYDALYESDVVTDMSEKDLKESELLIKWFKKRLSHISRMESNDFETSTLFGGLDETKSKELASTYMLDQDSGYCDGYGLQYGLCVINAEGLPKKKYLFKGCGFELKKNKKYEYGYKRFQTELQHPCNSMIVIDPYILADKNYIESNLINFLDTVLPCELKINFHLSIISKLGNPDKKIKYDPNEIIEKIKTEIEQIRPYLACSLGMLPILTGGAFHRRLVLTNNWIADFADGLNLFDENGKSQRNTTVDLVFPRLIGNDRKDLSKYNQWIRIAKQHFSDQSKYVSGSKENRLFKLVD